MLLFVGLAACNPVEGWRSLAGVNRNDPDPETAPFTANLAAAEAQPYPNLATVPPPPSRGTSIAERQKLAQGLVAERGHAQAAAAGAPAPPAPAGPSAGRKGTGRLASATSQPGSSAVTAPAPGASAAVAGQTSAAPESAAAGSAAATSGSGASRGKPGEAQQSASLESSLQMPEVRSVPQPEDPRPAPPRPRLPPPTRVPAKIAPPPAAVASATPEPAPALPVIAPPPPPPNLAKIEPKKPAATAPIVALELAGAKPRLDEAARGRVERAASLYKEHPGAVRVVAFAAASPQGHDPLANYHAALERAQTVVAALTAAGIPGNQIQGEAAPAGAAGAAGRVEIWLAP